MRISGATKPKQHSGSTISSVSKLLMLLGLICLATGCATYGSMTVEEKRTHLIELEDQTLVELVEAYPEAQTDLDASVGYAIMSNSATKIPFVGGGEGIGVVVDTRTDERSYLRLTRFDVGGGLGVRKFRVVAIFFDEEVMKKLASGKLELGAGAEAGTGSKDVGTGAGGVAGSRNDKRVLYQLSDTGAAVTFTVHLIKYSVLDLEE